MTGTLRQAAAGYLQTRRSLGYQLQAHGRLLMSYIAGLEASGETTITAANAVAWATRPAGASPVWHSRRLSVARCFARALPGSSGGPRRRGRLRAAAACRIRRIMSNRTPLKCGVLGNEQCGLANIPGDHEQLTRQSRMRASYQSLSQSAAQGKAARAGKVHQGVGAPRRPSSTAPLPMRMTSPHRA